MPKAGGSHILARKPWKALGPNGDIRAGTVTVLVALVVNQEHRAQSHWHGPIRDRCRITEQILISIERTEADSLQIYVCGATGPRVAGL